MMNAAQLISPTKSMPACYQVCALNMPVMDGAPNVWTHSFYDAFPPGAVGLWQRIAKSKWLWN